MRRNTAVMTTACLEKRVGLGEDGADLRPVQQADVLRNRL
jgi:hypothetical protein